MTGHINQVARKRKKYFVAGLLTLVIFQALDLITTVILTPDLTEEVNAFVRWYGFGWHELILASYAMVLFVAIPFYYHSCFFKEPSPRDKHSLLLALPDYFLRNDPNTVRSILSALFNVLGYFLFWFFIIKKFSAVGHNFVSIVSPEYRMVPFSRQMEFLDSIEFWFLLFMMGLFFVGIFYKASHRNKATYNEPSEKVSFPVYWLLIFFSLFISFKLFTRYASEVHIVEIEHSEDKDIVLVNIGDKNRADLGGLILELDSCQPAAIAVNAVFVNEKDKFGDSVLQQALRLAKNDILVYGGVDRSHSKFQQYADSGHIQFKEVGGVYSHIFPLVTMHGKIHEDIALTILKKWKPGFEIDIKADRSIPVKFQRTQQQFLNLYIDTEDYGNLDRENLKGKIFIVGYLGPTEEDKYYTPFSFFEEFRSGGPDSYGIIIIANAVRTLLDYEKKR